MQHAYIQEQCQIQKIWFKIGWLEIRGKSCKMKTVASISPSPSMLIHTLFIIRRISLLPLPPPHGIKSAIRDFPVITLRLICARHITYISSIPLYIFLMLTIVSENYKCTNLYTNITLQSDDKVVKEGARAVLHQLFQPRDWGHATAID